MKIPTRKFFLGTYPITPASDILHELAKHKYIGAKIFQAEDEIAGVCAAIGAAFTGSLALTSTSGPGLALKAEAIGLAMITELPLVVVDVQRGGPSTGLPTKTEQSDLLQALYGRNGESPCIIIAASTPGDCFDFAYMSAKIAMEHMTPVIYLTDGYLANGAEPWKIRSIKNMPEIKPNMVTADAESWLPYLRNPDSLARFWATPGMPGYEHRIGGLEKHQTTGNVDYDPENHELMCKIRDEKVQKVADFIPEQKVIGAEQGELLVVGWGGTYGHLYAVVNELNLQGESIGLAHFNYIKPLPKNTREIFSRYKRIVVCELNLGQFVKYLSGEFQEFTFEQYNKVQGLPFTTAELKENFMQILGKKEVVTER